MSTTTENNISAPLVEDEATGLAAEDRSIEVTKFLSAAPAKDAAITAETVNPVVNPAPNDASLGDFLSRPVLINSVTWTAEAAAVNGYFDPWTLWMNNTSVQSKFSNFHFMRGNLHLKFQINGTPFHYGRLMFSYEPAFGHSVSPAGLLFPAGSHSSLPHVIMDPSTNVEGRITCPFLTPLAWIDLDDADSQWIGVVHYDQLAPLTWASGTLLTDLEIQVYAWMEDVELAYPSAQTISAYTAQSSKKKPSKKADSASHEDEYTQNPNAGVISRPANTIANLAGKVANIPIIGPFARATQIGATALSGIAGLFGYSRPHSIEAPLRVINNGAGFMALTDIVDNSIPMSVGAKSELCIDPSVNGDVESADNLAISSLSRKWGFVGSFTWGATDPLDTVIMESSVAPQMLTNISGADSQYTPVGFASLPFRFWRGSMEVRVQVVCSRFHRGRLRIAWTPDGNILSATDTNLNYGRVIDIDQTTQYEFIIPFGRNVGYCYNAVTTGKERDVINGQFYIAVQNPLSNPEAAKDVEILVWVRGGEDLQFAGPSNKNYFELVPSVYQSSTNHPRTTEDVGIDSVTIVEPLWESTNHDELNSVYIGDPVRSYRSLLKRYEPVIYMHMSGSTTANVGTIAGDGAVFKVGIPFYPPKRGLTDNGLGTHFNGFYNENATATTLMNLLSFVYVGQKGSTRWLVTNPFTHTPVDNFVMHGVTASRAYGQKASQLPMNAPYFSANSYSVGVTDTSNWVSIEESGNVDGLGGNQFFDPSSAAFHVEIPPYNNNRFFPTLTWGNVAAGVLPRTHPDGSIVLAMRYSNNSSNTVGIGGAVLGMNVAAGEDFQFVGYRGIPPTSAYGSVLTGDGINTNPSLV